MQQAEPGTLWTAKKYLLKPGLGPAEMDVNPYPTPLAAPAEAM